MVLDDIDFWVQIHDLPTHYATTDFVEKVGSYVGTFLKADPNNFGGAWRSIFRARITLRI